MTSNARKRSSVAAVSLPLIIVVGLGAWFLFNPQNWLAGLFQARIAAFDAHVVVGPYPSDDDFAALRANGISTDVSLLDPDLPYERALLTRERSSAARYGLAFENFPMESVFGTRIGGDYDRQAARAAQFVSQSKGRVYLHCYLGLHRVRVVEGLLAKLGTTSAPYLLHEGVRSVDARLLDEAQADYEAGRYASALRVVAGITAPTIASRLLAAWSEYHLGNTAAARGRFASVVKADQSQAGAFDGLGFCALRVGELENAAELFLTAGRLAPKDASALTGLGLARLREGRLADAKQALSQAVALNPGDADARAALVQVR